MIESGTYGCVFEKLDCNGRLSRSRKAREAMVTKVQEYDETSRNVIGDRAHVRMQRISHETCTHIYINNADRSCEIKE